MTSAYVLKDSSGNSGQSIPLTQGESRTVTVFLQNNDGTPRVIPGTISTAVVKIFSTINAASIQKSLAASTLTLATLAGITGGTIGFQFTLSGSDTTSMAANNSGLPMIATLTDSSGNIYEFDFVSVFSVVPPVVVT